jgi:hypothetical protein
MAVFPEILQIRREAEQMMCFDILSFDKRNRESARDEIQ